MMCSATLMGCNFQNAKTLMCAFIILQSKINETVQKEKRVKFN